MSLQNSPAALVRVKIQEGLNDCSGLHGVLRYAGASVKLRAVALEHLFKSREAIHCALRNRHTQRGWVRLRPALNASASEISSQRCNSPTMAGASQNAFVW